MATLVICFSLMETRPSNPNLSGRRHRMAQASWTAVHGFGVQEMEVPTLVQCSCGICSPFLVGFYVCQATVSQCECLLYLSHNIYILRAKSGYVTVLEMWLNGWQESGALKF